MLSVWTVYDHPKDFPHNYVARRFEISGGKPRVTDDFIVCPDVDAIRRIMLDNGLYRFERSEGDDSKIIESWM